MNSPHSSYDSTTYRSPTENQPRRRFRFRNLLRRRKMLKFSPASEHLATSIRPSTYCNPTSQDDLVSGWTWCALASTVLFIILCLRPSLDTILKGILFSEIFLCKLPLPLANWMLLPLVLLTLDTLIRFELVLGIIILDWMNQLDWKFAFGRVRRWVYFHVKCEEYLEQTYNEGRSQDSSA